jgi:prepilin-type N-terminal cleavage/methylation domain-containing protein
MKIKKTMNRGFTLIELLVVITIIAVLASMSFPAYNKIQMRANIATDISNSRQIILGLRTFAADENDVFPYEPVDDDGAGGGGGGGEGENSLSTSTEAFNVLISEGLIDQEGIFWVKGNREKPSPPTEDGELEQDEVGYSYVGGQFATGYSRSPLIADEQTGDGEYGENHPWLSAKKAVVGFVGGSVAEMKLTSKEEGATVRSNDKQMENIFEERSGEDGGGGLRAKGTEVLHP